MGDKVQDQGSRRRAGIALALAVALALGVIVATKIMQDRAARQPVLLPTVEMPMDDSPQCAELVAALPDSLGRLQRAELAAPAPTGAALYRDFTDDRVTVRCGAPVPAQYTTLSRTVEAGGVTWLRVADDTPGLDLVTWFSVGASPIVAVTGSSDHDDVLPEIADRMGAGFDAGPEPGPLPLTDLAAPAADGRCEGLLAALPTEIAGRDRLDEAKLPEGTTLPPATAAWANADGDAITLRCGVTEPAGYARMADPANDGDRQLTQVGDIVWFTDAERSSGTTATYFALGRERIVAVHLPVAVSSGVLPELSAAIAANLENTAPSEQ
ncbi:DUF3515 domain-containing protein [Corynebacterium sphenisci]|uniref:DUF3515 domain-containing protein n=1 Tax=Corynebacterium sphenisci TaxID=191493 RepID=UPI0026E0E57C|nr:DUF3515 domain-containing protein [Corynebacterium sphenisci]MDO5731494.1 DUF3515 domain-containing protein [Corynebacterium sphenisci]